MDPSLFIIIALVICLGLIAGLYFVVDLLSQRGIGFAGEAIGREQREIVNHQRLARALNDLVDEVTILTDALKTGRVLRSHADATGRVATKKTARAAQAVSPAPDADAPDDKHLIGMAEASPGADKSSAQDPGDDAETRVLSRPDLQAATRRTPRLTPTRLSGQIAPQGGQS